MTDMHKTWVIGHRNPDTDSICSAIAYAWMKNQKEEKNYIPMRAGECNEETKFVLKYFGANMPKLTLSAKTQVRDIDIRYSEGVDRHISIKNAWKKMQDLNVVTLPVVNAAGKLDGIITVRDIAYSYMNVFDSSIMSKAHTRYANIIDTLEGLLITGDPEGFFSEGKVLVSAANPEMMEYYIVKNDLVILGNRYESQLCAIEMGASCLIICEGARISKTIEKLAQESHTTVIITAYDAFTAARLINQSMPIEYFMKADNLITFSLDDTLDDIRDVMANVRHRDFPVLDKTGTYVGMISRRNLLGAKGKRIILVDHNEKSQAVDGIEQADVAEIIDHHRLDSIETISPVMFRGQPLGCTATILWQMCMEEKLEIPKDIAGLLCSAIISDTLLFRSPTCTELDKQVAQELAKTAGINTEGFASDMFSAGSNLKDKTDEEIFFQDYKEFTSGKISFGVGQISSLNSEELDKLKVSMLQFMNNRISSSNVDMLYLMLTNILEENTILLCVGNGAEQLAAEAFHMDTEMEPRYKDGVIVLPGVVSRKKQLLPAIMTVVHG